MPKQKIYDDKRYAHFVTFSCYRRRRLLDNDQARKIVQGVLNSQLEKQNAKLTGFVIMPNHVHAVVWFPLPGQLSYFMKQWKQISSRDIRQIVLPTLNEYRSKTKDDDPFWQRKYYAFHIEDSSKLEEKLQYMHLNPVRAGLAERAIDWQWSSARYYELGHCVGVPIQSIN
ncbi:MAG: transposase [Planctomycetaceae bacterium]|nr:transposase [Planctomycetaceae bacterium]